MKILMKSLLVAVVMTMAAGTAFAQTDDFAVRASVADTCRISTIAVDIDFGPYLPWDADRTETTTLGVQCIRNTAATITWAGANDGDGEVGVHAMAGGTGLALGYDLEFAWGVTTLTSGGSLAALFSANSSPKTIDIDATLLGGQELVTAGSYSDTVLVTIGF